MECCPEEVRVLFFMVKVVGHILLRFMLKNYSLISVAKIQPVWTHGHRAGYVLVTFRFLNFGTKHHMYVIVSISI